MVRGFDIAVSKVSAAPLPVRAATAASLLSGASLHASTTVERLEPPATVTADLQPQVFRYNSFEFRYRQDVGRIVLIGQSPETGERVVQVPSEQALRVYAQRARAEKLQNHEQLLKLDISVDQIEVPVDVPAPSAPVVTAPAPQAHPVDISV